MALKRKELREIRKAIKNSHRPLIYFDDDCDGLASFLQVYKYVGDGKGVPVKDSPEVGEKYARKAEEYQPDLVIILDKPYVHPDFIRKVKQKIIWLDHHEPQQPKGAVKYYNPRIHDDEDNRPTSYWIYQALKENLWIAMTGTIADWHYPPDLAKPFRKKYAELLPEEINDAAAAIHDTELGKLIRIWSFNLKGTVRDTMASVKTLARIEDPYEILEQRSSRGKYIYRKYDKMIRRYNSLLESIEVTDDKLILFTYSDGTQSYTSDLSNEILYRHPDKIIIIGRRDNGWVKSSVRSSGINVEEILQECLKGVEGSGGGHDNACGCAVKEEDFDDFIECFRSKT